MVANSLTPAIEDVRLRLQRRIAERTFGRVRDLTIDNDTGRPSVQGRTMSYYLKQLAIQACVDVLGAESSQWQIRIDVEEPV